MVARQKRNAKFKDRRQGHEFEIIFFIWRKTLEIRQRLDSRRNGWFGGAML